MPVVVPHNKRHATAIDVVPPEAFVRQVADALAHLHDLPRLQTHPLARGSQHQAESTPTLVVRSSEHYSRL
jgi:hypothetical protein